MNCVATNPMCWAGSLVEEQAQPWPCVTWKGGSTVQCHTWCSSSMADQQLQGWLYHLTPAWVDDVMWTCSGSICITPAHAPNLRDSSLHWHVYSLASARPLNSSA